MRLLALRGISLLGFVLLVAWEMWKASNLVQIEPSDEELEEAKLMPFFDRFQVIDEHLLTTHPEDVEYAAVQRVRKQMITSDCMKRPRQEILPPGSNSGIPSSAFNHILVSDRHQMLYCAVPKVACTNWKRVLLVLDGYFNNTASIPSRTVHNNSAGYIKRLSDYNPQEISFRLSAYYKFLFVRHPFERLASAFRNKFIEAKYSLFKKIYGRYIMRKYRSKSNRTGLRYLRGEGLTFEEFVRFIIDSPLDDPDFYNEHWERIDRLCHPCLITYDFVGKLETLRRDSDFLLRSLELSDKVQFPNNRTRTETGSTKELVRKYFSTLSKESIDKLYDLYKHDFRMFNYNLPQMAAIDMNSKRRRR